jgi:hypothetical protein
LLTGATVKGQSSAMDETVKRVRRTQDEARRLILERGAGGA